MKEMLEAIRFIGIMFVVIPVIMLLVVALVTWHVFVKSRAKRKVLDKNGNP